MLYSGLRGIVSEISPAIPDNGDDLIGVIQQKNEIIKEKRYSVFVIDDVPGRSI